MLTPGNKAVKIRRGVKIFVLFLLKTGMETIRDDFKGILLTGYG
jgi:hypothetical protein